jgi:hypothetical protein
VISWRLSILLESTSQTMVSLHLGSCGLTSQLKASKVRALFRTRPIVSCALTVLCATSRAAVATRVTVIPTSLRAPSMSNGVYGDPGISLIDLLREQPPLVLLTQIAACSLLPLVHIQLREMSTFGIRRQRPSMFFLTSLNHTQQPHLSRRLELLSSNQLHYADCRRCYSVRD